MVLDDIPPHNVDTEGAIIGTVLLKPGLFPDLWTLNQSAFYSISHQYIWRALKELHEEKAEIDTITVGSRLREHGQLVSVGGMGYLSELIGFTPIASPAAIQSYREELVRLERLRKIREAALGIAGACSNPQGGDSVEELIQRNVATIRETGSSGEVSLESCKSEYFVEWAGALSLAGQPSGFKTGLSAFDRLVGGLHPGELCIVGARPGAGKTSLATTILSNHCQGGGKGCLFSLEMSRASLVHRMLSRLAGVDTMRARSGTLTEGDIRAYRDAAEKHKGWRLTIDDQTGSLEDIWGIASNLFRAEDTLFRAEDTTGGVIVCDYAQLVRVRTGQSATQDAVLSQVSGTMKRIAKETRSCVLLLSQLNRRSEVEGREEPQMSDLRGSGALEQDADMVCFLVPMESPSANQCQRVNLVVSKNRNGPIGEVPLLFRREFCSYEEP